MILKLYYDSVSVSEYLCGFTYTYVQVWTGIEKRPGTLNRRLTHDRVLLLYIFFLASENLPTSSPILLVWHVKLLSRLKPMLSTIYFSTSGTLCHTMDHLTRHFMKQCHATQTQHIICYCWIARKREWMEERSALSFFNESSHLSHALQAYAT